MKQRKKKSVIVSLTLLIPSEVLPEHVCTIVGSTFGFQPNIQTVIAHNGEGVIVGFSREAMRDYFGSSEDEQPEVN